MEVWGKDRDKVEILKKVFSTVKDTMLKKKSFTNQINNLRKTEGF